MIVVRWLKAFGAFWLDFIAGDDWTVAAAVAAGLLATWGLLSANVVAWWVLPLVVAAATVVSLRRAVRDEGPPQETSASDSGPVGTPGRG